MKITVWWGVRRIFTQAAQCLKFTRSHFSVNAEKGCETEAVSLCKLMLVFSLLIFTSRFVDQSHARLFVELNLHSRFFSKYACAFWRTGSYAPGTARLKTNFISGTSNRGPQRIVSVNYLSGRPLIPYDFLKEIFTSNFRDMGNLRSSVFRLIKMSFREPKKGQLTEICGKEMRPKVFGKCPIVALE